MNSETFGEGIPFERIRRITGYIVGDYNTRFNDAKKSECEDRVKHCENIGSNDSKYDNDLDNRKDK